MEPILAHIFALLLLLFWPAGKLINYVGTKTLKLENEKLTAYNRLAGCERAS